MKDSSVSDSDAEQQRFSFDMQQSNRRVTPAVDLAEPDTYGSAGEPPVYSDNEVNGVSASAHGDSETAAVESVTPMVNDNRERPGRVLAAERKRHGFSVSEVAGQLFLSEAQIRALEADNYDCFPAPIFVTGYLRNYARLLDLPSDPLIELLEPEMVQATPKLTRVSKSVKKRPPSSQPSSLDPRLIAGVVAAAVVLLLVWWGVSSDGDVPPPQLDDIAAVDNGGSAPLSVREPVVVTSQPVVPLPPPEVKSSPVPEPVVSSAPVVTAPPEPEPVAAEPPQPEFFPDRAAAEAFPDTLELTFSAESWVEITDADGRRVMFGLGKPGQTRALSGVAPFKILFGYSPAVSMVYNGAPFDQKRFARRDVARFTLGERARSSEGVIE